MWRRLDRASFVSLSGLCERDKILVEIEGGDGCSVVEQVFGIPA
jgi:hypothetical protein